MKAMIFVAITILAGAISGTILSTINMGIVEPFIDRAIEIENQNAAAVGEIINPIEFDSYRVWQKGGQIAAGTILGTSVGALFGIVFAYSRSSIPASNNKKKALVLAGVMFLVLFLLPAFKYPANPPAVGDPETITYRQTLYIGYLSISGFSALGLALLYRKLGANQAKKVIVPSLYAAIMIVAHLAMPPNPDEVTAPADLVTGFRITSAFTMAIFWALMAVILGALWDKVRPHETARISV